MRLLLALLLALFLPASAQAQANHITASLIAESAAAPGATVTLALRMQPAPGWHGYWSNPGDAGLGLALDWALPLGSAAGAPAYPVPQTLLISGLMNHVYEHDYAVLVPFTLPADARPGTRLPLRLAARWLACTDSLCVPEQAVLDTVVTVGQPQADPRPDPQFDSWRRALPAPLGAPARFALEPGRLRLAIPLPASVVLKEPHLFLGEDRVVDYAAPQSFSRKGDLLLIDLPRAKFAPAAPGALTAVLRLSRDGEDGLAITAAPGPVPRGGEPLEAGPPLASLPMLLLGALLGGLLLNVMPCVFPILSLKALSLARAGESEAQARAEGLAYGAGVILACLALGGLLLALRAGGAQVGWAFQLQEPLVVAALLLLATAITANLLGLYELAIPGFASSGSPRGAFATGMLAAFVATPCTGPFMAAAMGAALLLPTLPALALFAALGLGIALPFLAIAFVPALRRRMPRPGAWMAAFRRWMALPMGLTALALAWLAWRLGGLAFAGLALALALWLLLALAGAGRNQRAGRGAGVGAPLQLAALMVLGALILPGRVAPPETWRIDSILPTTPFSQSQLDAARRTGKPVFVYFTADWCLTCKVNEAAAIERAEVHAAFAAGGVQVLRGDWTRRDPAITRFLTAHGAAGVPLYLWYPAGRPEGGESPQQLPQVLSAQLLVDLAGK